MRELNVAVDVVLPYMLLGLKETVNPVDGSTVAAKSMLVWKPFRSVGVIVEVPVEPEMKLTGEAAEMLKSGGGPCIMSVKAVGVVVPPVGLPVTCTMYEPIGVKGVEEIVCMLEPVGVSECGLKRQEAPAGRVELIQNSATGSEVPLFNVTVIVLVPDPPCRTMIPPELDRE